MRRGCVQQTEIILKRLYKKLEEYAKTDYYPFHMPGHKASRRWFRLFRDAALDVTELSATDCLENPDGAIAEAQADIARLLGARRSYILTDGATAGVFALLYIVRKRGGKVLVSRNSHKSVYNACALLGVEPVIVQNTERDGVLLPPTSADIETALRKDAQIGAVLLTSPDYFGNVANYEAISKVCRRYEKLFFVTLAVKIENSEESPKPFDLSVRLTGIFETPADSEEERKAFTVQATEVLYPYLRAAVTNLTTAAYAAPLVLPVVNGALFPEDREGAEEDSGYTS